MNKKNLLVIGGIFLIAAALLAVTLLNRPMTAVEEDMVIISVDGKEYARVPLSKPRMVTVEQQNGCVNVVEVSDHGAVMLSSTCDNQLCVQMGEVTVDNWEIRPNQQFIICLPNRVSVELAVTE
ncbi:MAG: NusG domain II-containing protein [Clostridia bacterium]|nr:NusG domain II-containing protein [Clostridia bacterium]